MTEINLVNIMKDPVIQHMQRYIDLTNGKRRPDHAYQMRYTELYMLSRMADVCKADAISLAFEYGKAKGKRCALKQKS